MNCYVINLLQSADRLEWMRNQFSQLELNFVKVNAIDAKQLSKAQLSEICPTGSRSSAEIACFLSHRECWRQIAEGNQSWGAIFEDDIHLSSITGRFLTKDDWIPSNAKLIKLETHDHITRIDKKSIAKYGEIEITRLRDKHPGAAGYIISKQFAQELYALETLIELPVDHLLFNPISKYFLTTNIYQLTPAICIQDQFLSKKKGIGFITLITERKGRTFPKNLKANKLKKISRESSRIWKQLIILIKFLILPILTTQRLKKIRFFP